MLRSLAINRSGSRISTPSKELLVRTFKHSSRTNMDADEFRKAAHAAIEESMFDKPFLLLWHTMCDITDTVESNLIQSKHRGLSCTPKSQARLPCPSAAGICTRATAAMVIDPTRYCFQNRPRIDTLAITQLHGFLSRRGHLSQYVG